MDQRSHASVYGCGPLNDSDDEDDAEKLALAVKFRKFHSTSGAPLLGRVVSMEWHNMCDKIENLTHTTIFSKI